jgi:HD-like signal output (HDOD) protein
VTQFSKDIHELTFEEMQQSLDKIEIPPCPGIVTQVMTEAQKDAPDINKLTKLISGDVGMSAFAIKLSNSALFRRGAMTDNVAQAIARLGTRNIVCIVVATALRNSLSDGLPEEFLESFWSRAGNAAMATGMVARKLRGIPADLAYTFGLFHDAAIPVMMRRFPDYQEMMDEAHEAHILLPVAEDARYHCTHAVVGALLARNWGLQDMLVAAIRFHHDPDVYSLEDRFLPEPARGLIACTHVAEHVLSELNMEQDMEVGELYEQALAFLGLHHEDIQDMMEDLSEAIG